MSFRPDANTFLCLNFDEQLASHRAIDASGYEYQGIAPSGNPAAVSGPYTGKRARRLSIASTAYFSQLSLSDPRPYFRANCTVQVAFKSRLHTTYAANTRTLFQCGRFNDWYFFAWYQASNPGNGVRLYYAGSQAGPNTSGSTDESIATALAPTEDVWMMLTVRKTVTSGSTDADKLNTIDVWLTRLDGTLDGSTPGYSRSNVLNPNKTTVAPYLSVGYWADTGWHAEADVAGVCCWNTARSASELEASFNAFKGGAGDVTKPLVSNISPTPGTAINAAQPLSLDVTDAGGFRRVMVVASFPGKALEEVVHNGTSWGPQYAAAPNARSAIANGYRFTVLRRGGWPGPPTLSAYAVDLAGNEAD